MMRCCPNPRPVDPRSPPRPRPRRHGDREHAQRGRSLEPSPRTPAPRPGLAALAAARPGSRSPSSSTPPGAWAGSSTGPSAASGRSRAASARAGRGPICASPSWATATGATSTSPASTTSRGDMDEVYAAAHGLPGRRRAATPPSTSRRRSATRSTSVSWSQGPALKIIFLVGDAPPHIDYQDGYDYAPRRRRRPGRGASRSRRSSAAAIPRPPPSGRRSRPWATGTTRASTQTGGMPALVTPVDAELARLNGELASTVVAGGSAARAGEDERDRSWPRAWPWRRRWRRRPRATSRARAAGRATTSWACPEAAQRQELKARDGADAPRPSPARATRRPSPT